MGYLGTKPANSPLTSELIPDGIIATSDLQNNAVTEAKLQSGLYTAKAWVSFNGQNTVAITGSGNVSSITDGGTGNYTVNFTTAMPDANYAWASASYSGYPTSSAYVTALSSVNQSNNAYRSKTTTGINFLTIAQNGSAVDLFELCVTIFR